MNILVLGNDLRQMILAEMLKKNKHNVVYLKDYQENICRRKYDAVLFPIVDGKEYYQKMKRFITEDEYVFGAGLMADGKKEHEPTKYTDYMKCEEIVYKNAVATAEGTIAELIRLSDINISGSSCLITGYGRCGQILSVKLKALDCKVTVMDRNVVKRTIAEVNGINSVDFVSEEYKNCGKYDYIVNTVPAKVITSELLQYISKEAIILDIASAPGGVDYYYCRKQGIRVYKEPGLPGRFSAKTSAEIMYEIVAKVCNKACLHV